MASEDLPKASVFECYLCRNVYTEPKLLECLHTFCLKCLLALDDEQKTQQSVRCPSCTHVTPLPGGDIKALPNNDLVQRLVIVKTLKEQQESNTLTCSACSRANSDSTEKLDKPTAYCTDCEDTLCNQCCDAHRKIKVTAAHSLIKLDDDLEKFSEAMKTKPMNCEQHTAQPCSLYCQQPGCMIPICLMCAVLNHKGHHFTDLSNVAQQFRTQLQVSVVDSLNKTFKFHGKQMDAVQRAADDLQTNALQVHAKIKQRASVLHQLIDAGCRELQDTVDRIHSEQIGNTERMKEKIQGNMAGLSSLMELCRLLIDNGSYVELCRVSDKLIAKSEELTRNEEIGTVQLDRLQFRQNIQNLKLFGQASAIFGTVNIVSADGNRGKSQTPNAGLCSENVRDKTSSDMASDAAVNDRVSFVTIPEKGNVQGETAAAVSELQQKTEILAAADPVVIQSIAGTSPIRGIALLDGKLYVVCRQSAELDVYDCRTFVLLETLVVVGLQDAIDLAACQRNKYLYACESAHRSGFRIRLSDITTLAADKFANPPRALSVTKNANVLVVFPTASCLVEYTSEWKQVRQINTPLHRPNHAIQLSENQFVICGCTVSDNSTVIAKLTVIRSLADLNLFLPLACTTVDGKEHGLTLKNLTHLAIDQRRKIFVAGCHSHTVFSVNSDLGEVSQLFDVQHRILNISKICLGKEDGIIYAGIANIVDNQAVKMLRIPAV